MKKPICRHIGKPCIEKKCAQYLGFEVTQTTLEGQKTTEEWACVDYWQVFFQRQHVQRMDQFGASMDELRGQVARQASEGNALLNLFREAVNGQQAQQSIKNASAEAVQSRIEAID